MPEEYKTTVTTIAKYTNCPSFITIFHDYYQKVLPTIGMKDFEVLNKTNAVMRTLNQIFVLSWLPFWFVKLFGNVNTHPNLLISHYGKLAAEKGLFRYVNVKITKPPVTRA